MRATRGLLLQRRYERHRTPGGGQNNRKNARNGRNAVRKCALCQIDAILSAFRQAIPSGNPQPRQPREAGRGRDPIRYVAFAGGRAFRASRATRPRDPLTRFSQSGEPALLFDQTGVQPHRKIRRQRYRHQILDDPPYVIVGECFKLTATDGIELRSGAGPGFYPIAK